MSDSDKNSVRLEVQETTHDMYSLDEASGADRVYHIKARLLNNAIQQIGMGKYQVCPQLGPT